MGGGRDLHYFLSMKMCWLIALLLPLQAAAQTVFAPLGAVWHYECGSIVANGYERIEVAGDTLLDGRNARKLQVDRYQTNYLDPDWSPADGYAHTQDFYFTAQSSDSVWFWYGEWALLFNYAALPADSLVQDNDGMADLIVTDTTTIQINGIPLKRWETALTDQTNTAAIGPYVERVGSLSTLYAYFTGGADDGWKHYNLRCYSDDYLGTYVVQPDEPCDVPLSIQESSQRGFGPNPAVDVFFFPSAWAGFEMQVFDMEGKLRAQSRLSSSGQLDISAWQKGGYLLTSPVGTIRLLKE